MGYSLFTYFFQVVVDDLLDAGVTLNTGSKKVNLNHLLNFTFAKREYSSDNYRGTHFGRVKTTKYNKEQFLQAKLVNLYHYSSIDNLLTALGIII